MNWSSFSLFQGKPLPQCKGNVQVGQITKLLLRNLPLGQIVVLQHQDLDEVVAQELIDRSVKAVINCASTMSGSYPTQGPLMLLQQGISIWEVEPSCFSLFSNGAEICIYDNVLVMQGNAISCQAFTRNKWLNLHRTALQNSNRLLENFIDNTLHFAGTDKSFVLEPFPDIPLQTKLEGRHVLAVSRGSRVKKDLMALRNYIREQNPLLVGIDGGADVLLECGYKPDMIIGDMDSITDQALTGGSELIVHAYPDGYAPGMERLCFLGLEARLLPCKGTSEDAALLLAFEKSCALIVTVGAHTHMHDFLEKGRKGMGSTWLVRMKIGSKLIDAKGVSLLYPNQIKWWREASMTLLLSLFFIVLSFVQLRMGMKPIVQVVWRILKAGVVFCVGP